MTPISSLLSRWLPLVALAIFLPTSTAQAQEPEEADTPAPGGRVVLHPMIGVQTMWFNGDYQARRPLSPVGEEVQALGGGFLGSSNALHVEVEILPHSASILRFPVSFDAFFLSGKTTYSGSGVGSIDPRRLTFNHTASIYSVGTGVRAAFFSSPNLYLGAEARFNYLPATEFHSRLYSARTDETISESHGIPDSIADFRIGAYFKLGTQVEFFDPLLLDFSIGYGVLNLIGKETDPDKIRELLVIEPYQVIPRPAAETTLGYFGVGFSVIWKL